MNQATVNLAHESTLYTCTQRDRETESLQHAAWLQSKVLYVDLAIKDLTFMSSYDEITLITYICTEQF
jgi:hypothetical protein